MPRPYTHQPPPVPTTDPWRVDAACRTVGTAVMFPSDNAGVVEAKRVCAGCTVRAECLTAALDRAEQFGIWGGLSERERRRLRQHRATAVAA